MSTANRIVNPTGGNVKRIDTSCPQIGIVKEVSDGESMGRLKVWIKNSTGNENDSNSWITCNYASPFAGASDIAELGNNPQSYDDTQTSYGFWAVPPDINNEVIVIFINGDIRKAYWIACIYQKDMNNMVPGIPGGASYQSGQYGGAALPTAEYNKTSNNPNTRPYFEPLADGLKTQGLLNDSLRGAGNSGARRESPSSVFGWLTPGGNQFVMDDETGGELIRLRTASGAQILISEAEGHVYAISRDGKSWGELNVDGNVDFYAGAGCNFHADGDFNITAGGNVNIDAGGNINLKAGGNYNLLTTGNLNLTSSAAATLTVGGQFTQTFIGSTQRWQTSGQINISDSFPHPGVVNNTQPTAQKPALNQQSVQNANGQEVQGQYVTSRIPDHEPWPLHAPSAVDTPPPQEAAYAVSVGNVIPDAVQPLPVVGSPTKGMTPGVYVPQGYDKKNNPIYTFSGKTTELLPVSQLTTSQAGVNFIAGQEGPFQAVPYNDVGHKAIGYGHDIIPSDPSYVQTGPISTDQGLAILAQDVKKAEQAIKKYVKVPLTQAQFDALVDFVFNAGPGAISKGSLITALNAGNYAQVPNLLMQWVHAHVKGQLVVLPVLVKRRRLEALMFSTPSATS